MTEQEYLAQIDAASVELGYTENGESLVGMTGADRWIDAWREDPTLTASEQVEEEIYATMVSM